jgi:TPR repeat protein
LGVLLSLAESRRQDLPQAAQWYRRAAEQGHALAAFNLGLMYAAGQGVSQDDGAARDWLRRAAEHGDPGAQFNLGTRSHRASLDQPEAQAAEARIEAYKWLSLAAGQGYGDAFTARVGLSLAMSQAEVAEGTGRAKRFAVS